MEPLSTNTHYKEDETSIPSRRRKSFRTRNYRLFALVAGILCIILLVVFLSVRHAREIGTEAINTPEEIARIQHKLSELMIIPKDDKPVIAVVSDAVALSVQQPFFKHVQNGDILIIFPSTQQAVIYRESKHLIVNVGPVQVPEAFRDTGVSSEDASKQFLGSSNQGEAHSQ